MEKKISNIIFDFGNVLIDLDLNIAKFQMEQLLGLSYDAYHQSMPLIFRDYEMGLISENQFIQGLSKLSDRNFSDDEFRAAWNAMLLNIPQTRIEMLFQLRDKYQLYLFSNTNETHLQAVATKMGKLDFSKFEDLFTKCYYSYNIGYRKPDLDAFTFVIKDSGINPTNTLFIDDGWMHVEGARRAGLSAILHKSTDEISLHLDSYIQFTQNASKNI